MTLEKRPRPRATRRRGAELEAAILDAAWEQLAEAGYAAFTYEAVATRASTSRAVLYRRWPTREALVRAAIRRAGERVPAMAPDTGSLRGDMLALLRNANAGRLHIWVALSVQLADFYVETGATPADVRLDFIGDRPDLLSLIHRRAVARGDARPDVPQRVLRVAFDLFRAEAIMRLDTVPEEELVAIVDEVFLPLVGPAPV